VPLIEKESLEDFRNRYSQEETINFATFKESLQEECKNLAVVFQDSNIFMRALCTLFIDNPFPVLDFLQPKKLFLGKYEIIKQATLKSDIPSLYKNQYKHALLEVKPMLGEGRLSFELIFHANIGNFQSYRQNFFREIVLKNRFLTEQVQEFGELPGGILYSSLSQHYQVTSTLQHILAERQRRFKALYGRKVGRKLKCLSETEAITLGLAIINELEKLHSIGVLHSNLNPISVYVTDNSLDSVSFLDLELAIWEPADIQLEESRYFSQKVEDIYDPRFRMPGCMAPEHTRLALDFRRRNKIPKKKVSKLCDLYSIGAILHYALTCKLPPDVEYTYEPHEDGLEDWTCPELMSPLIISNDFAKLILKLLSHDPLKRHQSLAELKADLEALSQMLKELPDTLLQSLEHKEPDRMEIFDRDSILDLREFQLDDFGLEYLFKFVTESRIPNVCLFGDRLNLRALRENQLLALSLSGAGLWAEDLKLLSLFIKQNNSLTAVDLSNNPLLERHKRKNEHKGRPSDAPFKLLCEGLTQLTRLKSLNMSGVRLGPSKSEQLCSSLQKCQALSEINLAGCDLKSAGTLCLTRLVQSLPKIMTVSLSNNDLKDEGAAYIAEVLRCPSLLELDLRQNSISTLGAEPITSILTQNFTLQKLHMEENALEEHRAEMLLQLVQFNSHYYKLKSSHESYGEFASNLLAENIKRWAASNSYVAEKLRVRLERPEDLTDTKLAEVLLTEDGELMLKSVPLKYTYNTGDGTVRFGSAK
jgi:serine/threonine protein kinase